MNRKIFLLVSVIVAIGIFVLVNKKPLPTLSPTDPKQALQNCQNRIDANSKTLCAQQAIQQVLKKSGIEAGLDTLGEASDEKIIASNSCHGLAHQIGQFAYEQFKNNPNVAVSSKITYCNYGFYHGFMEALVQDSAQISKARDFCNAIDQQLKVKGLGLTAECYHGIGHGTVDSHDPSKWQDPKEVVTTSLAMCNTLAPNEENLFDCASGVFNGVANLYSSGSYGLKINPEDPFWLCKLQEDRIQKVCYGLMSRTLLSLNDNNLSKAFLLAQKVTPEDEVDRVIENIIVVYPNGSNRNDFQGIISSCHVLTEKLIPSCIGGYAIGLLQSGQPGKEYQDPARFCEQTQLTSEEKFSCFKSYVYRLKNYYTSDKLQTVCQTIDPQYRYSCT